MGLWNYNLCENGCGEVFIDYYCKKCQKFIRDYCKYCHEEHINEVKRNSDLARLKRDFRC